MLSTDPSLTPRSETETVIVNSMVCIGENVNVCISEIVNVFISEDANVSLSI